MACKKGIRHDIEDAKVQQQKRQQSGSSKDCTVERQPEPSNFFRLRQANIWGDYGAVLVSGYYSRDDASGDARLHRGGPFTPPLFFPWDSLSGHTLIVTDAFRRELERAPFGPLTFKPSAKDRIVHLPFAWESWDKQADTPRTRPPGGEPEAYIWDKPHSASVAAAMPEFWEVLPPVVPCGFEREESASFGTPARYVFSALTGTEYPGLFRNRDNCFDFIVDQPTRNWLEQRVGEWVGFDSVVEK
jgi:hypothetical protein